MTEQSSELKQQLKAASEADTGSCCSRVTACERRTNVGEKVGAAMKLNTPVEHIQRQTAREPESEFVPGALCSLQYDPGKLCKFVPEDDSRL